MSSSERYVTVSEARRVLGVSYITLWRWIREGRIRAVRGPSGRWLIPWSEIERLRGRVEVSSRVRAAIYARVSSRKQAEQGDLNRQVEALKKYATGRIGTLIGVMNIWLRALQAIAPRQGSRGACPMINEA